MKLKAKTHWTTRSGKIRYVRLYKAYRNMHDRCNGHNSAGNGTKPWLGLEINFFDWPHFRQWSLENGFSKYRNSLDRRDARFGYGPLNCRWITRGENTQFMRRAQFLRTSGSTSRI